MASSGVPRPPPLDGKAIRIKDCRYLLISIITCHLTWNQEWLKSYHWKVQWDNHTFIYQRDPSNLIAVPFILVYSYDKNLKLWKISKVTLLVTKMRLKCWNKLLLLWVSFALTYFLPCMRRDIVLVPFITQLKCAVRCVGISIIKQKLVKRICSNFGTQIIRRLNPF